MMRFVNTALPPRDTRDPDILGLLSVMVVLFFLIAGRDGETVRLWILGGVEFHVPFLWVLGVVAVVNLVVRGVVRWWRTGRSKVDEIFDEELGK